MSERTAIDDLRQTSVLRQLWRSGHIQWALWLFALAFVLRAIWISFVDTDPLASGTFPAPWFPFSGLYDEVFYYGSAQNLADWEGFRNPVDGQYSAVFPPGYPLALLPIFVLVGSHLLVAKLFNALLGSITAVFVYALATRTWNQRAGIAAGLIMALFPSQIFFSTVLMTETLFVTLSAGFMLLLALWLTERGRLCLWQAVLLGLFVGLMSLVRAEAVLLVPAFAVLLKLHGLPWLRSGLLLTVFFAGMVLVIAPWTARNYVRFDEFILIRGGTLPVGATVISGPGEEPLVLGEEISNSSRAIRRGLSPDYDDALKYELGRSAAPTYSELWTHYSTQPWDLFDLGRRKLVDLFGGDDDVFRWIEGFHAPPPLSARQESFWSSVANVYYFVVGSAALLGVLSWRSVVRPGWVLLWFIVSWSLIHLLFVPSFRYHFPVLPAVAALAAGVLVSQGSGSGSRPWQHASRAEPP